MMTTARFARLLSALSISAALAACSDGSGGGSSSGAGGTGGTDGSSTGTPTTGNGGQGGGSSASSSTSSSTSTSTGSSPMALLKVDGKLTPNAGQTAPATGDVLIIWSVDAMNGDYAYAFGSGQSTGTNFQLSLNQTPPKEALSGGEIGVGFVILYPTGKKIPDGKVDDKTGSKDIIGGSEKYAVIYKAPTITLKLPPWLEAFPAGYSCGKSMPAKPGETFDTFTPANCSDATITVDAFGNLKFPNWK